MAPLLLLRQHTSKSETDAVSIRKMQREMDHVLKVFMEYKSEMRNPSNRWRVWCFNVIAAMGSME